MTNPLTDPYLVLTKVYSGGKYLKQSLAETAVEPLNKARTVKICYGVLEKDGYLEHIVGANAKTKPKNSVKLVIKIALYMLEFMQKNDFMVVDYAVQLTKKLGKGGASGFVNAFLRSYEIPPLPQKAEERISVTASAPVWLVKKLRRSYKEDCEKILSAPSLGVCVRFERNAEEYLKKPHTATPFKDAYIFENFTRDGGFFTGDYTFQSIGSIAICNIVAGLSSQNGEISNKTLLDACAAPGGKSVLLSKSFKSVTACELHPHRVELINAYCSRMGAENVAAVQADSSVFNPEYADKFDAVLCDAPCSGTGVINENPDIKLFRKESDIKELTAIQLKILDNCCRYLKSGGILFYSTCSVLPEENDSVAHDFLQLHPEYALVKPQSPLGGKQTSYGLQFLPHLSMGAGFFITAFKKS